MYCLDSEKLKLSFFENTTTRHVLKSEELPAFHSLVQVLFLHERLFCLKQISILMEIKYYEIKHLIVEEDISGSMIVCKFKGADSSSTIQSSVSGFEFQSKKSKMMSVAKQEAKNVFLTQARNFLQRLLGSQFGWGASRMLDQGFGSQQPTIFLTDEEKKNAVVKAFEMISNQFEKKEGKWKIKESITA
jgi:hypothetical protein